jgi:hypothetical protein
MSEIDDLRRRLARLENALAGFDRWTLPGLYVPYNPRIAVIGDGSALAVGTHDYTVTSYGVPGGVRSVSLIAMAKWASASATSYMDVLTGGSVTEVYGRVAANAANTYNFSSVNVPVIDNQVRVKVAGANTSGTYILFGGYYR